MSKPVKPGASEAAEYVLGLLGQEDSRAFAERLKSDEALRAQVEYWEGMFSSLPGQRPNRRQRACSKRSSTGSRAKAPTCRAP